MPLLRIWWICLLLLSGFQLCAQTFRTWNMQDSPILSWCQMLTCRFGSFCTTVVCAGEWGLGRNVLISLLRMRFVLGILWLREIDLAPFVVFVHKLRVEHRLESNTSSPCDNGDRVKSIESIRLREPRNKKLNKFNTQHAQRTSQPGGSMQQWYS